MGNNCSQRYTLESAGDKNGVPATSYTLCISATLWTDRRGVTRQRVMNAMRLLCMRVKDEIYNTFRYIPITENITKRMIEDSEYVERLEDMNLAFLKTILNSVLVLIAKIIFPDDKTSRQTYCFLNEERECDEGVLYVTNIATDVAYSIFS